MHSQPLLKQKLKTLSVRQKYLAMDLQSQKFRFHGADKVEPERESGVRIGRGMWQKNN